MGKKLGTYFKLNFDFDYEKDSYRKGEKFMLMQQGFMALEDGAIISEAVAAKLGRETKQKMFVEV